MPSGRRLGYERFARARRIANRHRQERFCGEAFLSLVLCDKRKCERKEPQYKGVLSGT